MNLLSSNVKGVFPTAYRNSTYASHSDDTTEYNLTNLSHRIGERNFIISYDSAASGDAVAMRVAIKGYIFELTASGVAQIKTNSGKVWLYIRTAYASGAGFEDAQLVNSDGTVVTTAELDVYDNNVGNYVFQGLGYLKGEITETVNVLPHLLVFEGGQVPASSFVTIDTARIGDTVGENSTPIYETFTTANVIPDKIKGFSTDSFVRNISSSNNVLTFTKVNGTTYTAPANVLTTQGDMMYRTSSGPARLAKGTTKQVMAMNETATAPEWKNIVDLVYPIGSIYMSVSSTSPTTLFGGTWEALPGRFLLGAGTLGGKTYTATNTGGSTDAIVVEHKHTATFSGTEVTSGSAGIHSHTNTFTGTQATITGGSHGHAGSTFTGTEVTSVDATPSMSFSGTQATITGGSHTHTTKFTGTRDLTERIGDHHHTLDFPHGNSGSSTVTGVWRNSGGDKRFVTNDDGAHSHYFTPSGSVEVFSTNSSHSHSYTPAGSIGGGKHTHKVTAAGTVTIATSSSHSHTYTPAGTVTINNSSAHTHSVTAAGGVTVDNTGSSGVDANMPPYYVVYMWRRTA